MFSIFGSRKKDQKQNRDTQELPTEEIRRRIEEDKHTKKVPAIKPSDIEKEAPASELIPNSQTSAPAAEPAPVLEPALESDPEPDCESASRQVSIDMRAMRAKEDSRAMEEFISEERPFIRTSAARAMGRFITESDDEYMTAMEAFHEAVLKYEPERGSFPAFAGVVIRRRLLDQYRRQQKFSPEVSVDGATMDGAIEEDTTDAVALNVQEQVAGNRTQQDKTDIQLEIEDLEQRLAKYGFGFVDMKDAAPKSLKTREICREVSCMILREDIMPRIRKERHLPMQEICSALEISPKKIERHRKYIISVCEILDGDFPYLGEFLGETRAKLREAEESSLD